MGAHVKRLALRERVCHGAFGGRAGGGVLQFPVTGNARAHPNCNRVGQGSKALGKRHARSCHWPFPVSSQGPSIGRDTHERSDSVSGEIRGGEGEGVRRTAVGVGRWLPTFCLAFSCTSWTS